MPKFMLYGANPSELAQQQQNYERLFVGAAEGNRAAASQAANTSLSAFLQAQQADDNARQFDARNRIALFEEQRRRDAGDRRQAEDDRRYNTELEMRREDNRERKDWQKKYTIPKADLDLDLARTNVKNAKENNPNALKSLAFSHSRAEEDAANGDIESVSDALKLYPGLTASDAENYFRKSSRARMDLGSQFDELQSAANTLTAYEKAKRALADAEKVEPSGDWMRWGTPSADKKKASVTAAQDTVRRLEGIAQQLQNPKLGILSRLTLDPDSGVYSPVTKKPSWLSVARDTGTATGTSPAPAPASSGAPAFFNQPAPSTATTPPPAPAPSSEITIAPGESVQTETGKYTIANPAPAPAATPPPVRPSVAAPVEAPVGSSPSMDPFSFMRRFAPSGAPMPQPSPAGEMVGAPGAINRWMDLARNFQTRPAAPVAPSPVSPEQQFGPAFITSPRFWQQRRSYVQPEVSPEQNAPAPSQDEVTKSRLATDRRAELEYELRRTPADDPYREVLLREYRKLMVRPIKSSYFDYWRE